MAARGGGNAWTVFTWEACFEAKIGFYGGMYFGLNIIISNGLTVEALQYRHNAAEMLWNEIE